MGKENCELLIRAQALAKKKGLPSEKVVCVDEIICDGTFCLTANLGMDQAQDFEPRSRVEIFNARIEKGIRKGLDTAKFRV